MTFRGNHVDELISASLTGDLTDAERLELNAHLVRCETCRATLAAFTAERRILSGMPLAEPPRDMSARVRAGIESGRLAGSWWRRPGGLLAAGASLATVAAAVLAVVIIGKLNLSPVGSASNSPIASVSFAAGPSAVETSPASAAPTPIPAFALGPGELGYLSLTSAPAYTLRLSLINDSTGDSIRIGDVSGAPIAASLSPNGQWLAYITQKGESGANEVWAVHLTDGKVQSLGCSSSAPFTDRLAWSPDSQFLAYTLVGIDLGPDAGCQTPSDGADAWVFDTTTADAKNLTHAGNAYASSFIDGVPLELAVSYADDQPRTRGVSPVTGQRNEQDLADGVFMPLFAPDGNRAIFWRGTMTNNGGSWHFSLGGMPQLSGLLRGAGSVNPWLGTPLFTDLTPVNGEAFTSGNFVWGADSDLIAFWDGAWTGLPQSADGLYPSQEDVYVGRISSGMLNQGSLAKRNSSTDGSWVVSVSLSPDGVAAACTIGLPSAGIGDPPSANLEVVPLAGGTARTVGGAVEPLPWNGPAVYGY
ncbi:MAG TPA: zf-HC2 domain-containing protein [Methylomirabilota bacterium]|nr:zf-HC2 domain-containing protein [Methylomirabilota bacterium]